MTSTLLPGLLRDVKRLHPGIEIVVLEGSDEEVEEWLAADTVELGVVMNPGPGRAEVILGQDAWVAVIPAKHQLAHHARAYGITLKVLADQPLFWRQADVSLMEKPDGNGWFATFRYTRNSTRLD